MNTDVKQSIKTLWFFILALMLFLLLWPFLYIASLCKLRNYLYLIFHFWAKTYCLLVNIKVRIEGKVNSEISPAVFCCNHFSSFDNFAVYLLWVKPFTILGIEEIARLPLYGSLFKTMHVYFNRNSAKSKVKAMQQAMQRLENGESVVVAAEGGIKSLRPPEVHQPFEDGAFIMAIRKQVPLVPFVFKSNHVILPEFPLKYLYKRPCEISFLEPIQTKGLSMKDIPIIKEKVYQAMTEALEGVTEGRADLSKKSAWNLISEFR